MKVTFDRDDGEDRDGEWDLGLFGMRLTCKCVRCGRGRDWPEGEQRKMPAHDAESGLTVTADESCSCGATRVRIRLEFEEDDDDDSG